MTHKASTEPTQNPHTEITIQPDGRVYVQGLSKEVLEVLAELGPGDERLQRVLEQVRKPLPDKT